MKSRGHPPSALGPDSFVGAERFTGTMSRLIAWPIFSRSTRQRALHAIRTPCRLESGKGIFTQDFRRFAAGEPFDLAEGAQAAAVIQAVHGDPGAAPRPARSPSSVEPTSPPAGLASRLQPDHAMPTDASAFKGW
jgi:hypothetical protein